MPSMNLLPYTVLVVDSDASARAVLLRELSTFCFVQEAETIEDAQAIFNIVPVHVLLANETITDGDGSELCALAMRASPDTIRILYSEHPSLDSSLTAINQGQVWHYLPAPLNPESLRKDINKAISLYDRRSAGSMLVEELRMTNEMLERKVEERTRELVALHEELQIVLNQVQTLVATDELTGLLNRRTMQERLEGAFKLARRYQTSLSMVTFDIVNFSELNSAFGTENGDELLLEIAKRIRKNIRDVDFACRAGEDDFNLILPHTNSAQARVVTERMYRVLVEEPYVVAGKSFQLSMHFGIAEATSSVTTAADLFARVNEAEHLARLTDTRPSIVIYPDPENASPDTVAPNTGRRPEYRNV
ncbi:MAG: GGDEF domain-containing protein [Armatimonadota bacterium]